MSFNQWFRRWGIKHWNRKKFGKLENELLEEIKSIAEKAYDRGYEQSIKDHEESTSISISDSPFIRNF